MYTEDNFKQELKQLLDKPNNLIPTKAFCNMFQERLPEAEDVPEEFQGRDAEDYQSWGYALWGYFEDAEEEMGNLQVFLWMEFYEALDKGDYSGLKEAVIDIYDID